MKSEICLLMIAFFQVSQSLILPRDTVIVGEGESCGGFTQVPRICDTGLTCLKPTQVPNGPIIADLSGKCRRTANIVGQGKWCEAKARPENVKYCNDGLICVFPDTINELPDLPGVCQRPGVTSSTSSIEATDTSSTVSQPTATPVGEGESCGGFGGFSQVPRICDTGLTCLTPTQDPNGPIIADLPGICRATANIVGEGESCQSFEISILRRTLPENVKYCNHGLICVFPDTINELPDLPGVCQRPGVTFSTSSIEATGTSSIEETGTSSVVETGTSSIEATGTSSIEATGTSSIEATGTSSIEATGTSSLTTRVSSIVTSQTSVTVSTSTERIVVDHSTDLVRSTYTTSKVVQTTTYYATESDVVIASASTLSCFGIAGLLAFLLF